MVKEAGSRYCDITEQRGESYRWDKEENQRASFNVQGILPPCVNFLICVCLLMLTWVHMYAGVYVCKHTCGCASQRTTRGVVLSLLRHHPLFFDGGWGHMVS